MIEPILELKELLDYMNPTEIEIEKIKNKKMEMIIGSDSWEIFFDPVSTEGTITVFALTLTTKDSDQFELPPVMIDWDTMSISQI